MAENYSKSEVTKELSNFLGMMEIVGQHLIHVEDLIEKFNSAKKSGKNIEAATANFIDEILKASQNFDQNMDRYNKKVGQDSPALDQLENTPEVKKMMPALQKLMNQITELFKAEIDDNFKTKVDSVQALLENVVELIFAMDRKYGTGELEKAA